MSTKAHPAVADENVRQNISSPRQSGGAAQKGCTSVPQGHDDPTSASWARTARQSIPARNIHTGAPLGTHASGQPWPRPVGGAEATVGRHSRARFTRRQAARDEKRDGYLRGHDGVCLCRGSVPGKRTMARPFHAPCRAGALRLREGPPPTPDAVMLVVGWTHEVCDGWHPNDGDTRVG